ncbi:MAG TPA: phosphatase PAP2 family protein, partial [Jatrophihabitans sp.]|nr:phosphatase PAP2 family protein [Jatrophihabitans sp.]
MSAPLIAKRWRRPALWAAVVTAAGVLALAVAVAGGRSTSFDTWVFVHAYRHIGNGGALTLLSFSTPAIAVSICAFVAVGSALVRRWDLAALAVLGPTITVLVTEDVLKPIVDRALVVGTFQVRGVFPSGHEAAVASTVCVLVIVAGQFQLRRRARVAFFSLLALWVVVAALGLIRNLWHYATDTIGSMLLSVTVVSLLAIEIDDHGAAVVQR